MNVYDYKDQSTSDRQNTVYMRTYTRNIPSQPLQPYLDARPVLTKYSLLPVVDPRKHIDTPLIQRATYNVDTIFNPGNDFGPWSGFATNVNQESELRGQLYALQSCSQSVYVPSSQSDLYKYGWKSNQNYIQQPFPNLFKEERLKTSQNQNAEKIGYGLFNNATRQQLKDLTNMK